MRQGGRRVLGQALLRAREQTLRFFESADERLLEVPCLAIVNPPLWELGHVGWFQELWCLRWPLPASAGPQDQPDLSASSLPDADQLYDSSRVAHDSRWGLALPSLARTREYLERTLEMTLVRLRDSGDRDEDLYFFRLALFHELMHAEAFAYTWQTLDRPAPSPNWHIGRTEGAGRMLTLTAGQALVGRDPPGFCHDNEMPAQRVDVSAARIGAAPVTQGEFRAFVRDAGYRTPGWWDPQAYSSLVEQGRRAPRRWVEGPRKGEYQQYWYGQVIDLQTDAPVVHVDAHEAQAFCRWAGKRLPTESEWVRAATELPDFAWGDRVWEWTSTAFGPSPGFRPGPYRDYSQPWFTGHRVVRGGSFLTSRDMVDTGFRNFYRPERADMFIGFRVCA